MKIKLILALQFADKQLKTRDLYFLVYQIGSNTIVL